MRRIVGWGGAWPFVWGTSAAGVGSAGSLILTFFFSQSTSNLQVLFSGNREFRKNGSASLYLPADSALISHASVSSS